MRDCGGYGRVVPDICGDVGIVGRADALEFAERVGGIESGVGKTTGKKDNAEALSALSRAEKRVGAKKTREKRKEPTSRPGRDKFRSVPIKALRL